MEERGRNRSSMAENIHSRKQGSPGSFGGRRKNGNEKSGRRTMEEILIYCLLSFYFKHCLGYLGG